MRVTADRRLLEISPGAPVEIDLDVVNTADVIDGVSARVVGLDDRHVTARPSVLPLFPDGSGQLKLTIALPVTFPAGRHPVTVEVASHTGTSAAEHVDVDLDVAPYVRVELDARPRVQRSHRRASFTLEIDNRGNVPVDGALSSTDPDRSLRYRFSSTAVTVQPGQVERVQLHVRGPRHLFGGDLSRNLSLHAEAVATDDQGAALSAENSTTADTTVEQLARGLEPVVVAAGDAVFLEGDVGDRWFLVVCSPPASSRPSCCSGPGRSSSASARYSAVTR